MGDSNVTEIALGHFSFDLGDLPSGEFVKLSDALELAFYGGVRSIRYEGPVPRSATENGTLSTSSGTLLLQTDWGWIVGPKEIDVARPGAVLFGIEDNMEPDAIQIAAREQWYPTRLKRDELAKEEQAERAERLGIAPGDKPARSTPQPHDPAVIRPYWQTEILRRREHFFAKLNVAARSGIVRFKGTPIKGGLITEPSTYGSVPQDMPAAYFVEERGLTRNTIASTQLGLLLLPWRTRSSYWRPDKSRTGTSSSNDPDIFASYGTPIRRSSAPGWRRNS